jgi:hypothetical protein
MYQFAVEQTAAWAVHNRVLGVTAGTTTFENNCFKSGPFCRQETILDAFNYDRVLTDSLDTEAKVLAYMNDPSNYTTMRDGSVLRLDTLAGCIERDAVTNDIVAVRNLRFNYVLQRDEELDSSNKFVDKKANAWELAAVATVITGQPYTTALSLTGYTNKAEEDMFSDAIGGDTFLITIGYMLIIVYSAVMVGRRHRVHSGVLLSFGTFVRHSCARDASACLLGAT